MEKLTLQDVHNYHELQVELSRAILEQASQPQEQDIVFSLPNSGSVVIENETWLYKKHGMGVVFTNKKLGLVVDIDDELSKPQLIKVFRLVQYIESKSSTHVEFNEIKKALESLMSVNNEVIKKLPGEHYEISN